MLLQADCRKEREPLKVDDVRRRFRGIREMLKEATPEVRRNIVACLVGGVEAVDKKAVRVEYHILPALPVHELRSCSNQRWLPGVDSNHEPSG